LLNLQEKEKHGDMEISVALMEIYNLIRNKRHLKVSMIPDEVR